MRRAAVAVFLAVGIALTPFAIIGFWTQVVLLDTDRFVDLTDDLLDRQDVRQALGAEIAAQVVAAEPAAAPVRGAIAAGVATIANTSEFRFVFREAMRDLHGQLDAGDDTLALDLTPTLDVVRSALAEINATAASFVPSEIGDITIVDRDDQPILWQVVELADRLSIGAMLGALAAFGLAAASAESRWRMVGTSGVIVVAWALLLVVALPLLRNGITDEIPDDTVRAGARGAWVVVTRSLQIEALVAALIGVAAAGTGFVADLALARRRAARPAATSPRT